MGATNLIDVASYQGTNFNPNVLKDTYGINKISMKFTQGNNYANPYGTAQYTMTVEAGLIAMPYHYTVANGYEQAYEEAQYFIKYLKSNRVPTNTPVMLDLEDNTWIVQTKDNITKISNGWHDAVSNAGYDNQVLYMATSWFNYYYDPNANKIKKTWGAQYLYAQENYYNEPNLASHNGYDIWQFASTWGYKFPNGYWGGAGLDVSHDYTNAVSYSVTNNTTTTTTTRKEDDIQVFHTFPNNSKGILTFMEDAKSLNTSFGKGTPWQVSSITKDNGYVLSPHDIVHASKDAVFVFQPSPYDPDNYLSAKGTSVVVKYTDRSAQLYTEPTQDLSKNHSKTGADNHDWTLDNSMSYKVGEVLNKYNTVWLQVANNAYLRLDDVRFSL